ncbi:nitrate reductase associated protein [Rhizobium sp. HT1-10]|uniref:nitrate reductase associated protein n=1 Tax=Rhizobium sp. HT1-10 TaxID=3111638 RepID=UPI003C2A59B3
MPANQLPQAIELSRFSVGSQRESMKNVGPLVFRFETDFSESLRCIPMAVRFKLDLAGIKLSLQQWSRFTHSDRQWLLGQPCDTSGEVAIYHGKLTAFIVQRTGEAAKAVDAGEGVDWKASRRVPDVVTTQARSKGMPGPTADQWAKLDDLQRFALLKLTREGHDNENFVPAMSEFSRGLQPEDAP